ncbi:hypothetical protein Plhal304r1_c065g0152891 [Plasmopara halstedii]
MRYSAKINALLAGAPLSFQFHAENIVCSGLGYSIVPRSISIYIGLCSAP